MSPTPTPAAGESTFNGSCHCGAITYTINLPSDPTTWPITKCNCTICHKRGYLSLSPPDLKTFRLLTPDSIDKVGDYTFGRHTGHHRFCKTCGVSVFGNGYVETMGGEFLIIIVTSLDDVDLSKCKVGRYWDGRAEKWTEGPGPVPVAPGAA